jgi:hypothetical protein
VRRLALLALVVAGAAVLALTARGTTDSPHFSARITNPWFPLIPGTVYEYVGEKDGKPSRDILTVTHRIRTIDGAPCLEIHDRLYIRGRLEERTSDWYTQDRDGNVWYFGEATAELDARGRVTSTEGTWTAGVAGARPGIYITAIPHLGRSFRQEYFKGHAEDHFAVVGSFGGNAVLTKEWTPLEPGVIDHKLYVRGVGNVFEQTEQGGNERNELVAVRHG